MRTLNIGTRKYTEVKVLDEPSYGGACHKYYIQRASPVDVESSDLMLHQNLCIVEFQKGPIKEPGVNGIHNEDLIAIVIDRMEGFQSGDYECSENQTALEHLRKALEALNDRTASREKRGVEGTHTI